MQSPWTRDGKIRAEQVSVTPQVSGSITQLNIKDNQFVNAGDVLFVIDKTPFHIAELNAQAQLAKAQNPARRRRRPAGDARCAD
ncbi:auxiliary transport protein, membrane fusion protein (MFP) family [Salmonella enterica subsp. enterica serovar Heidelberg str. N18413]|nr:auxiliary transport protein, membrane fusion protein (MFP) family [Salmonella enterica subsp. enterica serovar Heidelberg str. N18413]